MGRRAADFRQNAVPAATPPDRPLNERAATAIAEQRVVLFLLSVLLLTVVVLLTFSVRATLTQRDVKGRAEGTFARAGLEQLEFHARRGRFALWSELQEEGVRLPSSMVVDTSNATASHWYLRVRDTATGLVCDRLGLRTDRPGRNPGLTCRPP